MRDYTIIDKLCLVFWSIVLAIIVVLGLWDTAHKMQENSLRVLSPYGGRENMYLIDIYQAPWDDEGSFTR